MHWRKRKATSFPEWFSAQSSFCTVGLKRLHRSSCVETNLPAARTNVQQHLKSAVPAAGSSYGGKSSSSFTVVNSSNHEVFFQKIHDTVVSKQPRLVPSWKISIFVWKEWFLLIHWYISVFSDLMWFHVNSAEFPVFHRWQLVSTTARSSHSKLVSACAEGVCTHFTVSHSQVCWKQERKIKTITLQNTCVYDEKKRKQTLNGHFWTDTVTWLFWGSN